MHFLTVWNSWLRQQISEIPSLYKGSLSFCFNDEGKQAVKTKAECFKAWRLFLFSSLSLSNMHYWPSVKSMTGYIWPNSFFSLLLDFLKVLYFFPRWLCHETSSFARFLRGLMHWSSLRSLLRSYKRSTCSKSSILFTKTMSGPMKKRTTPIYATCTSPIMYLICPSKLNIMVMQNLRRGGGGGGGANKVHYVRFASGESSYLDRTSLVNKGFISWPNYRAFDSQWFVLLLFSIFSAPMQQRFHK